IERLISIDYPGHLALAGSIIRSRDVDAGPDEILLYQFLRVTAGFSLPLFGGGFFGGGFYRPLVFSPRLTRERASVGLQRRPGLDLVFVYVRAIADSALHRQLMVAVFDAPGVDDL